jgi:hypothetical protein
MWTKLAILVVLFVSSPAWAQDAAPEVEPAVVITAPAIEKMTFVLDGDAKPQQKALEAAIEDTIDDMNFITRPIARGKLQKSNAIFKKITLVVAEDTVEIQLDSRKSMRTKSDGKDVTKWKRDDGDEFKVTQKREANHITQVYRGEDGSKVVDYNLSSDHKKMTIIIQVKSDKLPKPLTYTLRYKAI